MQHPPGSEVRRVYSRGEVDDVLMILGDCLDVLPTLEAGSVDAVITDPPYGTTACKWDSVVPLEPMWAELKRVLKPRAAIVLTASQPFTTTLIVSNRKWFKYCWVWVKSQPGDSMNAHNKPMRAHEDILVFSDGTTANCSERNIPYFPQGLLRGPGRRKNRYRLDGDDSFKPRRPSHQSHWVQEFTNYPTTVLDAPQVRSEGRFHPTQKPVALMEYLIRTYTNEGETVLDFAMGSGTTGVACVNTGRRFIGIEKDAGYFAIAQKRIAEAQNATPLFIEAM